MKTTLSLKDWQLGAANCCIDVQVYKVEREPSNGRIIALSYLLPPPLSDGYLKIFHEEVSKEKWQRAFCLYVEVQIVI